MIDIEEELKEIREQHIQDSKPPSKMFIWIIGIFMALLMATFIFAQYPLFGIILGQIESAKVSNGVLESESVRVVFTNETLALAYASWRNHPDTENSLCFEGIRFDNSIVVNYGYEPQIFSAEFDHVSHAPCSSKTIMMFHSHPYKRCTASEQDLSTLEKRRKENPDVIMIIMCEENRFSVY